MIAHKEITIRITDELGSSGTNHKYKGGLKNPVARSRLDRYLTKVFSGFFIPLKLREAVRNRLIRKSAGFV